MSNWSGGVLTAAGRVLQAKVEAGLTSLDITKIKLGDGTETLSSVDSLTDLVSPKAVLGVSSATQSGQTATITGIITTSQITAGFYAREWGLFADDPDEGEILYMITIDSMPEWLPPSTADAAISATYALNIAVANSTTITAQIDLAGLVDVDMLNKFLGVYSRSTAYSVGDIVMAEGLPAMHYLLCVTAGTTAATSPVIGNVKDGDLISDGTVVWRVTKAVSAAELGYRQPNKAYAVGDIAFSFGLPTGYYLECTTAGTTSSGALTISGTITPNATIVTDGTVTWLVRSVKSAVQFNKKVTFTSSGTFTAPVTGVYKITLQGGGGGGSGAGYTEMVGLVSGGGGGCGGHLDFYEKLIKGNQYSYIIGAGGTAGENGSASTGGSAGRPGGQSSITISGVEYKCSGGIGGSATENGSRGGGSGAAYINNVVVAKSFSGENGTPIAKGASTTDTGAGGHGGGPGGGSTTFTGSSSPGTFGGGGAGGCYTSGSSGFVVPSAGGDGYIEFEYCDPSL